MNAEVWDCPDCHMPNMTMGGMPSVCDWCHAGSPIPQEEGRRRKPTQAEEVFQQASAWEQPEETPAMDNDLLEPHDGPQAWSPSSEAQPAPPARIKAKRARRVKAPTYDPKIPTAEYTSTANEETDAVSRRIIELALGTEQA
jgi:hypothetical protein